jgi:hypothetical protein
MRIICIGLTPAPPALADELETILTGDESSATPMNVVTVSMLTVAFNQFLLDPVKTTASYCSP